MKEFRIIFLFLAFEVLGLYISDAKLLNDCVLFNDYLLAKIAAAALVIEFMLNFIAYYSRTAGIIKINYVF